MAGVGAFVSVTIDIGDVETGLHAMERRARQLRPAFQQLKTPMRVDQKEHAAEKRGPDGGWAPRAASTVRMHKKLPRKLLGRLPTAVGYSATSGSVVAESKVAWSEAHQDGARVGRGARLPARPFLWISDGLMRIAEVVLETVLAAAWGGR